MIFLCSLKKGLLKHVIFEVLTLSVGKDKKLLIGICSLKKGLLKHVIFEVLTLSVGKDKKLLIGN